MCDVVVKGSRSLSHLLMSSCIQLRQRIFCSATPAERREDGRLFQILSPCSDSETPIAECTVGRWNEERSSVRRSKRAPTRVRDELTVVSKVRWQLTEQRLMDQQRQLELYALPDRQPTELTKYWRNVLTATGACNKTRCRILNAEQVRRSCRKAMNCSNPIGTTQTPAPVP